MRKRYTIEQFIKTEMIHSNSISFDDKSIVYASDRSGVYNAYAVSVDGQSIKQLTRSTQDTIYPISYFPADHRLLYLCDKGGNEIFHLYVQDESGQQLELTTDENERAQFYRWSQDGKSFFYGSNKRDPRYLDVYEMDIETYTPKLVFQNDAAYEFQAISNDKRYLAFVKVGNMNDSDIYLYDCEQAELKHITPHSGDIQHFPHVFSHDSQSLYYTTDQNAEFRYLVKYSLDTAQSELIHQEAWDIQTVTLSHQGNYLILGINQDAHSVIKILDLREQAFLELPSLPDGEITSVRMSSSEQLISFLHNGSTSPSNLYVYDLTSKELTRLTDTLNPEIDPQDLVKAEVVRYPSFDGLAIPAIYYKPKQQDVEKLPALVWVHGGPGGQSTVQYNPIFQFLVNHGYAIIAVNNRGSSGYGKSFFKAADLKHGEVDLADCIAAKDFLIGTGEIDEQRIGIMGGSYGGFMTLAALAFKPQEFAVGVNIFGVSNWERTLKSIPAWWESIRDALYQKIGNPYTDEAYIRSISPLFHAHNIVKPLLVLQGANDPRVLKIESDEIVEKVAQNGVPVEYIVFEDEGHGFTKKDNQIKGYQAILSFLNTYLI